MGVIDDDGHGVVPGDDLEAARHGGERLEAAGDGIRIHAEGEAATGGDEGVGDGEPAGEGETDGSAGAVGEGDDEVVSTFTPTPAAP